MPDGRMHAMDNVRAEELMDEMIEDYTAGTSTAKPTDATF
jgi:hypothetical protein